MIVLTKYQCEICDKIFDSWDDCKKHEKSHAVFCYDCKHFMLKKNEFSGNIYSVCSHGGFPIQNQDRHYCKHFINKEAE